MAGQDFQYGSITLAYSPYGKGTKGATDYAFGTNLRPIVPNLNFDLIWQAYFVMFPVFSFCFQSMDEYMVTSIFLFWGERRVWFLHLAQKELRNRHDYVELIFRLFMLYTT